MQKCYNSKVIHSFIFYMNIFEAVLILLLLVAVSAFVSCSELALASSRKIKLQVLGKEGDTRALDVLNMQEQP